MEECCTKEETAQLQPAIKVTKKKKDKVRKRDHKATENVLKELESVDDNEKFQSLTSKYNELYNLYRAVCSEQSQFNKQLTSLQREKETLQSEQNRLLLARTRLEVLCRELQKQNKDVKDQCMSKIRDEEERRKSMTTKFQETLNEVTTVMQENTEKNLKIRDENLDMVQKIRDLYNEFELRKEQAARMEQQMDLERKLYKAEVEKLKLEYQAEREMWSDEKKIFQETISRGEKTSGELQTQIELLQKNLEEYTSKYSEFQDHVSKSNQVFVNCKSEIASMVKRMEMLDKDSKLWKKRFENNSHTIVDLKKMKATLEAKVDRTERQIQSLQKLCHQLQAERGCYMKQLKSHGIEPVVDSYPEPSDSKEGQSVLGKELATLKGNLKVLQEKLSHLTSEEAKVNDATRQGTAESSPTDEEVVNDKGLEENDPGPSSSVDNKNNQSNGDEP